LHINTKETGFFTVLKAPMQYFGKKPGFCVQEYVIT